MRTKKLIYFLYKCKNKNNYVHGILRYVRENVTVDIATKCKRGYCILPILTSEGAEVLTIKDNLIALFFFLFFFSN